jgi:hypothetical protein
MGGIDGNEVNEKFMEAKVLVNEEKTEVINLMLWNVNIGVSDTL